MRLQHTRRMPHSVVAAAQVELLARGWVLERTAIQRAASLAQPRIWLEPAGTLL
jgi:hypothetical protein